MINLFVTSGTQLPFPRMLNVVDTLCDKMENINLIVQSTNECQKYKNFNVNSFLSPIDYLSNLKKADVIISHAGMGSIISAFEENKTIAIMGRKFKLGEHRNDHQASTIKKFKGTPGVYIFDSVDELFQILSRIDSLEKCDLKTNNKRYEMIKALEGFLKND